MIEQKKRALLLNLQNLQGGFYMDFENKEQKLRFELLEKAYYAAAVKNQTKTRCPVCNELI